MILRLHSISGVTGFRASGGRSILWGHGAGDFSFHETLPLSECFSRGWYFTMTNYSRNWRTGI